MKNCIIILVLTLAVISCKDSYRGKKDQGGSQEKLLLSVVWFQRSAEMQALYYQGYNLAEKSLAKKLKERISQKPGAVVLDIDETILDNSPVEALQVLRDLTFSDSLWLEWVRKASARPLPGALEFTKFAESNGIEVFYVTNRENPEEYEPTLRNLKEAGFPFADSLHLLLKDDASSKEQRRKKISGQYEILLLAGDNLADFDPVFDNRSEDLGSQAVKNNRARFGTDFIIFPNPMYGPWVKAAAEGFTGDDETRKLMNSLRIE